MANDPLWWLPQAPQSVTTPTNDLLGRAKAAYAFINQYNPAVHINPNHSNPENYFAETFLPNDEGYGEYRRPQQFPSNLTGVEVYKPDQFTEHDLAAEFLHRDPIAHATRAELLKSMTPAQFAQVQNEGDFAQPKSGPPLSLDQRLNNITDAMMRGYTIGQWPKEVNDRLQYSPKQLELLNGLKKYMTTGKK